MVTTENSCWSSVIPGFQSLRICRDLQDFFCRVLQRSLHWILKIHTDLQDLYRSVQICKIFTEVCRFFNEISAEICFSAASKEPIYWFLDFFSYFIEYFSWPRVSHLILLITQKSWEGKFVPITKNFVTGENAVLVKHGNLYISLELSRSDCWTLRGSFAILTSFWPIKLDMWQPSGLVDVLMKSCFCNISAT